MNPASPAELRDLFERQRARFPEVRRLDAAARGARLRRLRAALAAGLAETREALRADFGKPEVETELTEYLTVMGELDHAIRHLGRWMRPRRVPTPWSLFGTSGEVRCEPKGVVLVISPWNYPYYLALSPVVAALAAGNTVVLKPSELTPRTSALLARLVGSVFPPEEAAVVEGGREVATALLDLPFQHVFFTGSTAVGRVVMTAAARTLTPVTLELGGKSPVVVDASADLEAAATRTAWGKCLNAGQTCIAPDYAWVPEGRVAEFAARFRAAVERFYGADPGAVVRNPDLARIVSAGHFARVRGLVEGSVRAGARVEVGGVWDEGERRIAPTLLSGVGWDMPVMGEEIFGPVLPVMGYRARAEVYERLRSLPKPLALYVFAEDRAAVEEVLRETTAGGTTVNNTILHVANPDLPFGGDGASGFGRAHGWHGFAAFSNERSVLRQGRPHLTSMLHPPYGPAVQRQLGWMRRWFG